MALPRQPSDTDMVRVIVTMKPGKKGAMVNALRAQAARVNKEFSLIEGFAGELPVGLLRAIQNHPDVLAFSIDGAVTSSQAAPPVGTIYTVTNTSNSGAGSLRRPVC